jgi:hypothetical protein
MSLTAPEELARLEKLHDILKNELSNLGIVCDHLYETVEEQRDEISMLKEILDDLNVVIFEDDEGEV